MNFVELFKNDFSFLFPKYVTSEKLYLENTIFGRLANFEFELYSLIGEIRLYDTGLYVITLVDKYTFTDVLNLACLSLDDESLLEKRNRDFELLHKTLLLHENEYN